LGRETEFVRTPKHGIRGKLESWSGKRYRAARSLTLSFARPPSCRASGFVQSLLSPILQMRFGEGKMALVPTRVRQESLAEKEAMN
jgi:hypothetical protein